LALSAKCKNYVISSNLSLEIISPNPGVDRILFQEKYDLSVGF
jgi:hypothetical protein